MKVISALLGLGWVAFMIATPLLAVWLASSLIAYAGGPTWLAVLGGLVLFPALPLWWERRANARWHERIARARRLTPPKRHLTTMDRLVLRTLFLSVAFIAALLAISAKTAFTALATRGDWFLADSHAPAAEAVRSGAVATAESLEWLHELANPNPYKREQDEQPVPDAIAPTAQVSPASEKDRWTGGRWRPLTDEERHPPEPERHDAPPPPPPSTSDTWQVGKTTWPWPNTVHPVVAGLTAGDEGSIETVARTIAARVTDPFERVKALHDWVVTRLTYDEATANAVLKGSRQPQDAQSVFTARTGVCEGYARLLVELGRVTGDRIVYVTGEVREQNGQLAPVGHAWNAVEINGAWYLLDATWDDPIVNGKSDTYRTDYLFIPPSVATLDHLPDDPKLQLLEKPISRGDFVRQPLARPGLAREGLALIAPEHPTVDVTNRLDVVLDNPRGVHVMLQLEGAGKRAECGVSNARRVEFHCDVPAAGRYEAMLFTNRERWGNYASVASLQVNAR